MATQRSDFEFPLNILSCLQQNKDDDKRADERLGRKGFQHFVPLKEYTKEDSRQQSTLARPDTYTSKSKQILFHQHGRSEEAFIICLRGPSTRANNYAMSQSSSSDIFVGKTQKGILGKVEYYPYGAVHFSPRW
jgi:hypothetical protein